MTRARSWMVGLLIRFRKLLNRKHCHKRMLKTHNLCRSKRPLKVFQVPVENSPNFKLRWAGPLNLKKQKQWTLLRVRKVINWVVSGASTMFQTNTSQTIMKLRSSSQAQGLCTTQDWSKAANFYLLRLSSRPVKMQSRCKVSTIAFATGAARNSKNEAQQNWRKSGSSNSPDKQLVWRKFWWLRAARPKRRRVTHSLMLHTAVASTAHSPSLSGAPFLRILPMASKIAICNLLTKHKKS